MSVAIGINTVQKTDTRENVRSIRSHQRFDGSCVETSGSRPFESAQRDDGNIGPCQLRYDMLENGFTTEFSRLFLRKATTNLAQRHILLSLDECTPPNDGAVMSML
jgi:hypothetical protein